MAMVRQGVGIITVSSSNAPGLAADSSARDESKADNLSVKIVDMKKDYLTRNEGQPKITL